MPCLLVRGVQTRTLCCSGVDVRPTPRRRRREVAGSARRRLPSCSSVCLMKFKKTKQSGAKPEEDLHENLSDVTALKGDLFCSEWLSMINPLK